MKLHHALVLPAVLLLLAGLPEIAEAQNASAVPAEDRGAQVSVAPLRIELAGKENSAVLRVSNPSRREIGVQVRVFGWAQQGGEDAYFASSDVMITPSIIQIAPGQTQIFRVLRRDAPSAGEKRFRVAVDQLPDPTLERAGEAEARIRFTLPLFIDRDQATPGAIAWTVDGQGLHAHNGGGQTQRIVGLKLATAAGAEIALQKNGLRYVQGGSAIAWPIDGACPAGPVTITANIDGGTVSAQAVPSCS
ncbi:MAG: hypothetical protein RLZZ08_1575 [Pseudomonadota bacterium]|jgi:fimbrial chaperone protein